MVLVPESHGKHVDSSKRATYAQGGFKKRRLSRLGVMLVGRLHELGIMAGLDCPTFGGAHFLETVDDCPGSS